MPIPQEIQHAASVDQGVKSISYCPLCEASYSPESARIVGEKGDSQLTHVCCGNCVSAILALVMVSEVGVSSVGLVTDLAFDEVRHFQGSPPVSTDDVIEAHRLLKDDRLLWEGIFA
jgi:hypothetical protein